MIKEPGSVHNRTFKSNTIKDMLHFELDLSRDLTTEILKDSEQFTNSNKYKHSSNKFVFSKIASNGDLNETTIRYVYYDLRFKECFNF